MAAAFVEGAVEAESEKEEAETETAEKGWSSHILRRLAEVLHGAGRVLRSRRRSNEASPFPKQVLCS